MTARVLGLDSPASTGLATLITTWRGANAAYNFAVPADVAGPAPEQIIASEARARAARAVFDYEAHDVREIRQKLEFILEESGGPNGSHHALPWDRLLGDLRRLSLDDQVGEMPADDPPIAGGITPALTLRLASAVANLELVQIGVQLDRIFPELMRRIILQSERCDAAHEAAHREYPNWSVLNPADRQAVIIRHETIQGVYADDSNHEALSFRIEDLSERAVKLRATSQAALRTKARLLNWSHGSFEDMPVLASLLADLGVSGDESAGHGEPPSPSAQQR